MIINVLKLFITNYFSKENSILSENYNLIIHRGVKIV
ncbi:hypothetical protein SAMN05428988_5821 [Chitinophaga sp. YR573]|jgi:hypothetical protein|nr:hypothetical protein SAMN05428988_5821 [Chitinophaga sp. YR573]